jgi:hypothetical protein
MAQREGRHPLFSLPGWKVALWASLLLSCLLLAAAYLQHLAHVRQSVRASGERLLETGRVARDCLELHEEGIPIERMVSCLEPMLEESRFTEVGIAAGRGGVSGGGQRRHGD